MKRLIGAALVLALILPAGSAVAGDMFQALSRLPATVQASLTPMDEAQLAAIEGGLAIAQSNTSTVTVTQSNFVSGSGSVTGTIVQQNSSTVRVTQGNSANLR